MSQYIALRDYAKHLNIKPGDMLWVSSDTKIMLFDAMRNRSSRDLNDFIDGLKEAVGPEGTLLFPTFNWDFCHGAAFDIKNTPSLTGSLGQIALGREDFVRTHHALYSFAVWGKYADQLVANDDTDAFGEGSIFAFMKAHHAKNLAVDVNLHDSFTYIHYVEQGSGVVKYRYVKPFTGPYIDEAGNESTRTYSMFVRDLDMDVSVATDLMEPDLIEAGAAYYYQVNNSRIREIDLEGAHQLFLQDILTNKSRKCAKYKGQEE